MIGGAWQAQMPRDEQAAYQRCTIQKTHEQDDCVERYVFSYRRKKPRPKWRIDIGIDIPLMTCSAQVRQPFIGWPHGEQGAWRWINQLRIAKRHFLRRRPNRA